ncbi:MAG: site-specific DNA-methyltransferase [Desulfobacterales bacterium]|nr:site-specific DNA-methyltransferase [Desulfobacterales bacterium]
MAKTNLTDEEKRQIIEAINDNAEPPPKLMPRLFPHVAEKYDVAALDRAKIATLEYAGKRSEAAILNQTFTVESGSPLQAERLFKEGSLSGQTQLEILDYLNKSKTDWMNLIVQGDNLQFLKTCFQNQDPLIRDKVKGKVKLVYIDPPFATKSDFKGAANEKSYSDKVASAEFIEGLRERLIYLREILSADGSIYIHLDQKMVHYVKVLMDEIFGKENFVNEIIWRRTAAHNDAIRFGSIHDLILYYSKTSNRIWNSQRMIVDKDYVGRFLDNIDEKDGKRYARIDLTAPSHGSDSGRFEWHGKIPPPSRMWAYKREVLDKWESEGKIHWPQKGMPRYKKFEDEFEGPVLQDIWTDIRPIHNQSKERLGYPTQKPEDLLERVILASSNKDDLILDIFAGTGTVAAVAEKLGCRWIVCDFGKHAIYTMQKRILRIGESKDLGKDVPANKKYGKGPQPFCVVSCGAYDFSRIMNLRENKDAYINFVLGLFQLPRDAKDLNGRFGLTHIYGEKDGHPVEVYPVWEDEYLKNIRIDEEYLQQILIQSGGKLRGDYYIITPETCTVISDTTLKNAAGKEVHFKLLKFPYKVLEEVSRNFQITEQPSAQENVNNLINATGFYFNNAVEIAVKKIKGGLKITEFKTGILDRNGEKFSGLEGLAMLLVDVDYDDNIFDMEKTFFAKDINDDREIKIPGLTGSVAVIAIDKHGNESNPFVLKE